MDDKKYQVFISSTFSDLREERNVVMMSLLDLNCIPAGMEMFPASDFSQFEVITSVIDNCDYYVLILAGRYGSLAPDGVSYTEKEYRYAKSKGIPILSFVHADIDEIPSGRSETSLELKSKLAEFRALVTGDKMVRFWSNPDQLAGHVSRSLANSLRTNPRPGWVRGDKVAPPEVFRELSELRAKMSDIRASDASEIAGAIGIPFNDLAQGPDKFVVEGTYLDKTSGEKKDWKAEVSWSYLLKRMGHKLAKGSSADDLAKTINEMHVLDKDAKENASEGSVKTYLSTFDTITSQFQALEYIYSDEAGLWKFTPRGNAEFIRSSVVLRSKQEEPPVPARRRSAKKSEK